MSKRKKRLKKGILSLEKQLIIHEEKLKRAEAEDKIELVSYYKNEILAKKKDLDKKQRLLRKQ